ncbi:MAG: hypothetical protein GXO48_08435 [Chlorobi bacterium]|nr:hypothetical protein [Chlorobiota bacterium]
MREGGINPNLHIHNPITLIAQAKPIDKEKVDTLPFCKEDVLPSEEDRQRRRWALNRALTLGNIFKHKAKIYFMTDNGPFYVYTTIWALTEKNVLLKAQKAIPICSIFHVELV